MRSARRPVSPRRSSGKGNKSRRPGAAVRPTSGLVRDALFNSLAARTGGARVLDLFAGTGALGIEALRRGAAVAVFVERDAKMADGIRRRLAGEGFDDQVEIWRKEAHTAVFELGRRGRQFDLILLDPPYGQEWIPRTLHAIAISGALAAGGLIVAEGHWRDRPEAVAGLVCTREARYGETVLWYFSRREEAPA